MKLGIQETKEMLGFILGLGNALGESLEDGELSITDLPAFVSPLLNAGAAFTGASEIPKELIDLDDAERVELIAYAKETLDIPENCIEDVIECGFDTLAQIHLLVQKIRACCPVQPEA